MSLIGAALIGAAGSLGAAAMSKSSAEDVNKEQVDLANTRYQRGVKDLRAAGLNPILAAGGGSSAAASVPTLHNPSQKGIDTMLASASSAADLIMKKETIKNMEATHEQIRQETALKREQTRGVGITNDLEEHKKGVKEKGWNIADDVTEYILQKAQDIPATAKEFGRQSKDSLNEILEAASRRIEGQKAIRKGKSYMDVQFENGQHYFYNKR